jgi:hypothetical protein
LASDDVSLSKHTLTADASAFAVHRSNDANAPKANRFITVGLILDAKSGNKFLFNLVFRLLVPNFFKQLSDRITFLWKENAYISAINYQ